MKNNKNRLRDRPKSDPELRKIHPKENGIVNGEKTSGVPRGPKT
jgi:hypothetical protein